MKALNLAAAPCLLAAILSLGGCAAGADLGQLDARLEEIKARPRGRIEPPPEFKPIATFTYGAHKLRPPFSPPVEQELVKVPEGRKVEPDMSRPREYLERFSLDALRMVGTITKPGKALEALMEDPAGAVTRIRVGSYLGKNFGRVVAVRDNEVSLVEIVPDGHDGWVERSRAVSIAE
ncbi:type 4 fimbrial biogenesis protein PilP [Alcanivorax xiamenensis]|uniref:Type 4 fimbrial biogenesis protein PilP n=1 Tax=Alcanivorax xiamenensis TaxID=1177156 RepID=A0ABQ6Y3X0_9GAMM|nr:MULTISPECIES: pilus assembly protein PilP [Alcanivorax]KAF0803765.1 type 4 fimbrial biogenesis protein PilP [Alcanivorax xiamenensis]